jgi:ATP-binding cassette subfamily F protein 3
MVETS